MTPKIDRPKLTASTRGYEQSKRLNAPKNSIDILLFDLVTQRTVHVHVATGTVTQTLIQKQLLFTVESALNYLFTVR